MRIRRGLLAFLAAPLCFAACGDDDAGPPVAVTGTVCRQAVVDAMPACARTLGAAHLTCMIDNGAICEEDAPQVGGVMRSIADSVGAACSDSAVFQAGYGPTMTEAAVVARVQEMCRAEARSVAIRAFGGPHGVSWADADADGQDCLVQAYSSGVSAIEQVVLAHSECLAAEEAGGCDLTATEETVDAIKRSAGDEIRAACPAVQSLIGIDAGTFVDRTAAQADCLTAAAHPSTAPLALACGPSTVDATLPRGSYEQIVLDEDIWGTRCGDGSPYAFQVRLAPEGSPVDNVLIAMQGGGVCLFEQDCLRVGSGLFEALNDGPPRGGIMSNDPAISPFADWTKVYLPYCTQDVFIGGGVTSEFNTLSVERYGAVNVRAALRYVRDALWAELDRTTVEGYRPEGVRAFIGGFSAGAFGTLYNYHWVLDDLQWPRTTAYPDAGLALDNGQPFGVGTLGNLLLGAPPLGWASRPFTPPYCFRGECAVGPNVLINASPRLGRFPEQQFMILTNQVDDTQVGTTFFTEDADWVNAMRQSYCDTKDLPGIHYFLPAEPESIHVISPDNARFTSLSVDGQTMQEWFTEGIEDPTAVMSRVVEGSLVGAIPGVEPFPCELAP